MKIKRVKEFTSTNTLVKSLEYFIDTAGKHSNERPSGLGIRVGKGYFTSRPAGLITAHGYAQAMTDKMGGIHNVSGTDAVRMVIEEIASEAEIQKQTGRWVRFAVSLNPEIICRSQPRLVDIDRLLALVIEDTLQLAEKAFFPDDKLGYFLGLDHDGTIPASDSGCQPQIQARVFVLPQTERQTPLNLGSFTQPTSQCPFSLLEFIQKYAPEVIRVRAHELGGTLNEKLCGDITSALPKELAGDSLTTPLFQKMSHGLPVISSSEEWVALVNECAWHAVNDMEENKLSASADVPRFLLNKFTYYLTTSTQENVLERYRYRLDFFRKNPVTTPVATFRDYALEVQQTMSLAKKRMTRHSKPLGEAAARWVTERNHEVKVWQSGEKAVLTGKQSETRQNRTKDISKTFRKMRFQRHAFRINLVGLEASLEVQFTWLFGSFPKWIETLGRLGHGLSPMPNLDILRRGTTKSTK